MNDRELSIDELLADVADLLEQDSANQTPAQSESPTQVPEKKAKPRKEKNEKKMKEPKSVQVKSEKEPEIAEEKPEKPAKAEKSPRKRGGFRKFAKVMGRVLLFLLEILQSSNLFLEH